MKSQVLHTVWCHISGGCRGNLILITLRSERVKFSTFQRELSLKTLDIFEPVDISNGEARTPEGRTRDGGIEIVHAVVWAVKESINSIFLENVLTQTTSLVVRSSRLFICPFVCLFAVWIFPRTNWEGEEGTMSPSRFHLSSVTTAFFTSDLLSDIYGRRRATTDANRDTYQQLTGHRSW